MFCPYCGAPAAADPEAGFCTKCGKRLQGVASELPTDWSNEVRYETLIQIPQVREQIAAHAAQATAGLSGEDFLKECEKGLGSLLGGVPISKVAAVALPFYAKLGIRTGKSDTFSIPQPIGIAIVGVLCSLARHGQAISNVQQHADGCTLEAVIPSDFRSFAGTLLADIRRDGSGSKVQTSAMIKGQLFDWGKSRSCLKTLAGDLLGLKQADNDSSSTVR